MNKIIISLVLLVLIAGKFTHKTYAIVDPLPQVQYTINGQSGIVTANAGDPLNIAWSAANVAYCKKWGVWGAGDLLTGLSGTDNLTAPFPTVVTGYNYEIDCYDSLGLLLVQGGAQLNVSPAPVVSPTPTPTPTSTTQIRVKGEGTISDFGENYVIVNRVKVVYSLATKLKLISGNIAIGKTTKWEGSYSLDPTIVTATRLEIQ